MEKFRVITILFLSLLLFGFDVFQDEANPDDASNNDQGVFMAIGDENLSFKQSAKIIILNKITANSKEFVMNLGSRINFGRAEIKLHKCAARKDNGETIMLVSLNEKTIGGDVRQIFKGWLFSKSPSISTVEHPVYQLFAVSCV